MLRLAIIFFVIALISGAFGFGITGEAFQIGKILLAIFVVLAVLSLVFGGLRGGRNSPAV